MAGYLGSLSKRIKHRFQSVTVNWLPLICEGTSSVLLSLEPFSEEMSVALLWQCYRPTRMSRIFHAA